MRHFNTKKFLAALVLGGVIVCAGTAPAAEATVEISVVAKMETKVMDGNYYVMMRVPLCGQDSIAAAIVTEIVAGNPKPFERVTDSALTQNEIETLQETNKLRHRKPASRD